MSLTCAIERWVYVANDVSACSDEDMSKGARSSLSSHSDVAAENKAHWKHWDDSNDTCMQLRVLKTSQSSISGVANRSVGRASAAASIVPFNSRLPGALEPSAKF